MSGNLKIFLVGYTGAIGSTLVKLLATESRVSDVVLIGRRNVELPVENKEKFSQKIVDFDNLDSSKEVFNDNFDGGFCCLGTTRKNSGKDGFIKVDRDYILKVAELAKEGNCKQFHLVSSAGANSNSMLLYTQIKGEVEATVTGFNFLRLFIYRPKMLLGEREESRIGERVAMAVMKPLIWLSPTCVTTPYETLAGGMLNFFLATHNDLAKVANETAVPEHKIVENKEIFERAAAAV